MSVPGTRYRIGIGTGGAFTDVASCSGLSRRDHRMTTAMDAAMASRFEQK